MRKSSISCLLVALLFVVPMAVFISPEVSNLENERRKIASFPDAPPKIRARYIKKFFQDFDAFFADRFPLRSSMLSLSIALHEANGDSLDMSKCYRGRGDWLFLGNSYQRCVDKLQGNVTLSGDSLKRQMGQYKSKHDAAHEGGAEFFILIGPNKSSIYPEYLPPLIFPGSQRFISPLIDSLSTEGVNIYDPTERLVGAKNLGLLYYRTDTHWNAFGAYEAFEGFRDLAGLPSLPPISFEEASTHAGDLVSIGGYNNFPLSTGDNFTLRWSTPPVHHDKDGLIANSRASSEKTAWIFGDSFAEALRPYIIAMFKEVRFFKHAEFDTAMASTFHKPDIILWVIVERSFAQAE